MIAACCFPLLMLAGGADPPSQVRPRKSAPRPGSDEKAKPPDEAILVQGRRPAVTRDGEGSTYDLRGNAQGQAGTAADVLNTVPSVNVSPDGSVTIRGNDNVQVYVNGRPSAAMLGENRASTLQAMSGGSIASVEVITNPSARFDANGGAILNIVLKKGQGKGLQASVAANAGDRGRKSLSADTAYAAGKISATLNASLRDNVRLTRVRDDRRIFAADGSPAGRFVSDARYTPTHRRRPMPMARSLMPWPRMPISAWI